MKRKLNSKLVLNKETLRTLQTAELKDVMGGISRFCDTPASCPDATYEESCVTCGSAAC